MATVKPLTLGLMTTLTKVLGNVWANWTRDLTQAAVLQGTGDPSGSIVANCGTLYVDTTGTLGAVLYIKEDPADNGTTNGWRAV
jgi:hypothetical protein